MMANKLCIIIASIGRAELLSQTVANLIHQTRKPDHILIVSVQSDDVAGVAEAATLPVEIIFSTKGSCAQRNAGLRHMLGKADYVTFFDDDFVPAPKYLEELVHIFSTRPDVVGVNGRLIADGINSPGISFEQALELIANDMTAESTPERLMPALYGCNFSVRCSAIKDIWFDEALPLYGWQEDVDFSFLLGQRGALILSPMPAGVHMGTKGGRTSGKRFGYSQIANPIYLLRKKTIPPRLAWRLVIRNFSSNCMKSITPEPYIDRRGRLAGNLLAIGHLLTGRLRPQHILKL